ncbi:MAG: tetratricopeptide repeat protein [Bryobacteraceae bacterium]|nr:tetratricopeptide repeat protein [Bryobacteraceae bacterium]
MPKRSSWTVNTRFLLLLAAGIPALAIAAYFWHGYQVRRNADALLARADKLAAEEEWSRAAETLYRYLKLKPDAIEARVRLAETYDRAAKTPERKRRAVSLYFEALAVVPENTSLRRRLGELLLEVDRPQDALAEAKRLLETPATEHDATAYYVRAVALAVLARTGNDPMRWTEVAKELEQAIALGKGTEHHIELGVRLASLLRDESCVLYSDPDNQSSSDSPPVRLEMATRIAQADAVIDEMVAANESSANAWLVRHKYRKNHNLPGAEKDLEKALALQSDGAPDGAVLLAAADDALARGQVDQALQYYEKCSDKFPWEASAYHGAARCYAAKFVQSQDPVHLSASAEVLRRGLRSVGEQDFDLNMQLMRTLIQLGSLGEASDVLVSLDKARTAAGPTASPFERARMKAVYDLLDAERRLAANELDGLPDVLRGVVTLEFPFEGSDRSTVEPKNIKANAYALMGEMYTRMQQWDLAVQAYQDAVRLRPDVASFRLAAGRACEAAGLLDAAIDHYQEAAKPPTAPAEVLLALGTALLKRQLMLPSDSPDWASLEQLLERVKSAQPDHFTTKKFAASLSAARGDNKETVLERLRDAESISVKSPADWRFLILSYQQLDSAEADKALERYQNAGGGFDAFLLRADLMLVRQEAEAAGKLLAGALPRLAANEQRIAVLLRLAALATDRKQLEIAERHLEEIRKLRPGDPTIIDRLCSIALAEKDYPKLEKREAELRRVEGRSGCNWRAYRIYRLLAIAGADNKAGLAEAQQLVRELEAMRPRWRETFRAGSLLAERQGNIEAAIALQERAMELDVSGAHEDSDLARLLDLYQPAERASMARVSGSGLPLPLALSSPGSRAAIGRSIATGNIAQAVADAQEAARRRPKDPVAQVWLGYTQWLAKNLNEAEKAFMKAKELAPSDPQMWYELIRFLHGTKATDKLAETLAELSKCKDIPEPQRSLAAARAYTLTGDRGTAESHYTRLLNGDPNRIDTIIQAGVFYFATDANRAEELLRDALRRVPSSREVKRTLAQIVARSGTKEGFREAVELLSDGSGGEPRELQDKRLLVDLLLRRGELDNVRQAAAMLEGIVLGTVTPSKDDRLSLAAAYTQLGEYRKAAEQIGRLAHRPFPAPDWLAHYADFLLRYREMASDQFAAAADEAIARLEKAEPQSPRTLMLRAKWLKQADRTAEIAPLVEAFLAKARQAKPQAEQEADLLTVCAKIYESTGDHGTAEATYREAAKIDPKGKLALAGYLATRDSQAATSEAVDLCLPAAGTEPSAEAIITLCSVLATGKPAPEAEQRAEPLLAAASGSEQESESVLAAVASLRFMRGRLDEADALFNRALEISPHNMAALNNQALLRLARGDDEEALAQVNRAIAVAGRVPALTDTLGLIHLSRGDHARAIELFLPLARDEAVGTSARFHLALAYELKGDATEARAALAEAYAEGLKVYRLTAYEQELLVKLQSVLDSKSATARRTRGELSTARLKTFAATKRPDCDPIRASLLAGTFSR